MDTSVTPMTDERLAELRQLATETSRVHRDYVCGYALNEALDDNDRLRALVHEQAGYIDKWAEESIDLRAEVERLKAEKDGAYHERNQVVAALAKLFPAGVAVDPDEPDWPVLYIDLPDGQGSWHFQRSEAIDLLAGIPKYDGEWDGHSTEEKYARLQALAPRYFHLANFLRPEPAP